MAADLFANRNVHGEVHHGFRGPASKRARLRSGLMLTCPTAGDAHIAAV